jgi:hypothetical protein
MAGYVIGPRGFPLWEQDPQDGLDYDFDWSAWLGSDTISSYTVTVQTGLTKDSDSRTNGIVTVWLSGGTVGRFYKVTCHVITGGGRKADRSIEISIKNK